MACLLVQSCSKTKNSPGTEVEALDLYSGYYFKIIKKASREGALNPDLDICILSAKYGLIDSTDKVREYDWRMQPERASDLRDDVLKMLQEKITRNEYDRIIINLGQDYLPAIEGISDLVDVDVQILTGGLGERGHQLKQIIRTDSSDKVKA